LVYGFCEQSVTVDARRSSSLGWPKSHRNDADGGSDDDLDAASEEKMSKPIYEELGSA
jgi:hypothetical protein